jgi:asparagine synthetase B (glutamine-hydrolysing)
VIVVLHGELYPDSGSTGAEICLEAYLRNGMGFVTGLHGSYVLAVIDKRQGRLRFVTDSVNSRKLFFGRHDGVAWFSTQHAFGSHPCSRKPDPVGFAHCIVNGVPLSGRTLFDGVRVLQRASIHDVGASEVRSEPYWSFEPGSANGSTRQSLKSDLRDALLAAVERRLPDRGEVCLSLSGGYDSTAILGALRLIGATDVRCFSYGNPTEADLSDASVARQMTAITGYAHTEYEAHRDEVATVVAENVRWGQGMTRLVVETDLWRTLREQEPATHCATIWVGDECFGMHPARTLHDNADVLNSLGFADWSSLGSLKGMFPLPVASFLGDALRDDLDSMLERNRAIRDPYLLRDYLYLDQRLPRLLSWREAFDEPCGEVRNPLIDRDVLDLIQQFPKHLKLGKSLFKDTVTELFPDLFAVDRAAGGIAWYAGQWCRDVVWAQSDHLARMIRANSSPLDPYLPPEGLLRVIDREASHSGARRRLTRRVRRKTGQVRRRIRTRNSRTPPAPRPQQRAVDPAVFILRAISLREFYRRRSSPLGNVDLA